MIKRQEYDKKLIAHSFSRFAAHYDDHAVVQHEIGHRLLERCQFLKHPPKTILDLGSGTGSFIKPLQAAFPKATILSLDLAWGMIAHSKKNKTLWQNLMQKHHGLQADMEALPFQANTFDLIFSNCCLQWANDLDKTLKQITHCLKPDGAFFFSTLGPSTLHEVKQLWAPIDPNPHVHEFLDLQTYGDSLMRTGFKQIVVDQETLTLEYQSLDRLLKDLKYTGARNLNPERARGLTTLSTLKKLQLQFDEVMKDKAAFSCSYEAIYGHALGGEHKITDQKTFFVDVKRGTL